MIFWQAYWCTVGKFLAGIWHFVTDPQVYAELTISVICLAGVFLFMFGLIWLICKIPGDPNDGGL